MRWNKLVSGVCKRNGRFLNLDELEGHLGRDVDTFDIMLPCPSVVALLSQVLGKCKVLIMFTKKG